MPIDQYNSFRPHAIAPFLKWPGGKSGELNKIRDTMPEQPISRYFEPFLGGGALLLSINEKINAYANDACPELIDLFNAGSTKDEKIKITLERIALMWNALDGENIEWEKEAQIVFSNSYNPNNILNLLEHSIFMEEISKDFILRETFLKRLENDYPLKTKRMLKVQTQKQKVLSTTDLAANIEGSVRAAFYMAIRQRYNSARLELNNSFQRSSDFFFLREYSYAAMFRFNSKGAFNVPYGGVTYNRKNFYKKINALYSDDMSKRLSNTQFFNKDFENFLNQFNFTNQDFIFVDPPYDSDFSEYDDLSFTKDDQTRLANLLSNTAAKVMLVIGDTPLIRKLYSGTKWKIAESAHQYKWTIKSRNDREKNHLTIINY